MDAASSQHNWLNPALRPLLALSRLLMPDQGFANNITDCGCTQLFGSFPNREIGFSSQEQWNLVERRIHLQPLAACEDLARPGILPGTAGGKVSLPVAHTLVEHWRNQQVRAEQVGVFHGIANLVIREIYP